jgi:hypothetical protein
LGPRTVTTVVTGTFDAPACGAAAASVRAANSERNARSRIPSVFRQLDMFGLYFFDAFRVAKDIPKPLSAAIDYPRRGR